MGNVDSFVKNGKMLVRKMVNQLTKNVGVGEQHERSIILLTEFFFLWK